MRVISGIARGRRLKQVPGETTRPIMDRVKENLFNILGDTVAGARWLDLFAGTGQVGIEALSRGAASVVFVDNVKLAVRTVQANLTITGLLGGAEIRQSDAFDFLRRYTGRPFDLIYIAPPQYQELWLRTLNFLDERASMLLSTDGVAVVQIDPREFQEVELAELQLFDRRRYGNTQLNFYKRTSAS